jgi:hypothetical protein
LRPTRPAGVFQDMTPKMDLLEEKPHALLDIKRNIFEFREDISKPVQTPLAMQLNAQTQTQTQTGPTTPDVRYLGFYLEKKPSRVRLAAISNGGTIYVGGVGDVLAQKYQVLKIDDDYIILKLVQENRILKFPIGKDQSSIQELNGFQSRPAQADAAHIHP